MNKMLTTAPDLRAAMLAQTRQVIDMSNFCVTFGASLSLMRAGLPAAPAR